MLRFPDLELPPDHPDRDLLTAIARRLDVPDGGLALLGSMSEYIQHGLAITPQLRDAPRQQALTDRFLTPALPALEILLLKLRAELDPALRQTRPFRGSKPYPLGQCLEITKAVQQRLATLDATELSGSAAEACAALREFVDAGGQVRRAWGDLRGRHFQNALIVGTLYVDVANDTVVITKPAVEILPFAKADFKPIADYIHFARIAQRYWNHRILPNHVLPQLAPYLPLIQIAPNGGLRLGSLNPYMLSLTLGTGFSPSEQALAASALPPRIFDSLGAALRGGPIPVAGSAEEGREAALAACRAYRTQARCDCAASFNNAMAAAREVNRRLAKLIAVPKAA
jgi:hypothetical protein